MIKNAIIYRIGPHWQTDDLEQFELALTSNIYVSAAPSQETSSGWTPPRGEEHGALVEAIGGQLVLKFMVETKAVPSSALDAKVKEKAKEIEATTGRKPGRKESKEIKAEIKLSMLPMAFSKRASTLVWINRNAGLMVIDASTNSRADEVVTALVRALDGFSVALLDTQISPTSAMAGWLLTQDAPAGFAIERGCELKSSDESKSVVRYDRHSLDLDEIKQHISQGKLPTRLAMSWNDRVFFNLTQGGQLRKIDFADVVFEEKSVDDGGFDADVAIMTGELAKMLPDLIEALGGKAQHPAATPGVHAPVGDEADPLYDEAVKIVRESGRASISYVQRHLRISYNRAARLLEAMETDRVVTPMDSSGARKVIGGAA